MENKIESPAATGQITKLRYPSLTIPAEETQAFLRALTAQDDPVVTIATITDCKANRVSGPDILSRTFHDKLSGLYPSLVELNKQGAGVFYVVNETNLKGRKKENITRIRAVWQDDDHGRGWKNWLIEPNAVIETSEGKFQRLFFTDSQKLDEFDGVQAVIVASHGSDPGATGISRLLRLPGFFHMKNPDNPFMVHVVGDIIPERWAWDVLKATFPPATATSQVVLPPPPAAHYWHIGKIYAALQFIPADEYKIWTDVGMGIHHASGGSDEGLALWDEWSKSDSKWVPGGCAKKWKTFSHTETGKTEKSIFKLAHDNGWDGNYSDTERGRYYSELETRRIFGVQMEKSAAQIKKSDAAVAQIVIDDFGVDNILYDGLFCWAWESKGVWQIAHDRDVRQKIHKFADLGRATNNTINSILNLFKDYAYRPKFRFNYKRNFINCRSGELHLENGIFVLNKHTRENYCTTLIPIEYNPGALCPRFEQFLAEVFEGDVDANEKSLLVYEMIGYCILSSSEFEKFFILIGPGANGKSVLMDVLKEIVGSENTASVQPSQFENKFQRAHMHGKLLNLVTEIAEGAQIADAQLKSIVSGELTTAEHKNKDPFEFEPFSTCVFGTNHMPHPRDFSNALFRRAAIIRFNRTFDEHEQDRFLRKKLKSELPGIFVRSVRALEGVYFRNGFVTPESSGQAKNEWRKEADQVAQFVDECCTLLSSESSESNKLYGAYQRWANAEGINKKLNHKNFTTRIMRFGVNRAKGSGGIRLLTGIILNPVA